MNIQITKTIRRVTTLSSIQFDLETLKINPTSWAFDLLTWLSKLSLIRPRQSAEIERLHWAMRLLSTSDQWAGLMNMPPSEINVKDLSSLFADLERRIDERPWAPTTKNNTSAEYRKCIRLFLQANHPKSNLVRCWTDLRGSSFKSRAPRPLISDMPDPLGSSPIGALAGTSTKLLKAEIRSRLQSDLERIRSAALSEVAEFQRLYEWFEGVARSEVRNDIQLRDALAHASKERRGEELRKLDGQTLLSFYVRHSFSDGINARMPPSSLEMYFGCESAHAYASTQVDVAKIRPYDMFLYPFIGNGLLLLSCLLLLQCHTGWNASSVLSLSEANIQVKKDKFIIQGFKSKSDDHTPPVEIFRDDSAYRAVSVLLARLNHLRRLHMIDPEVSCVWQRPKGRSVSSRSNLFRNFQVPMANLCAKYKLPHFSLDQIRTQVLALTSTGLGGLEQARRIAGHVNVGTTAHYLDQLLLHRLNSSINLAFQKQLECSVKYASLPKQPGDPIGEPDDYLLYPTGDGTSCLDPFNPPKQSWAIMGVCEGSRCHSESGCSNMRVLIDTDRVAEVARTTLFYELHWADLLSENREAFEEIHLPAMLFNLGLNGILERGAYGPVLRAVASALRKI